MHDAIISGDFVGKFVNKDDLHYEVYGTATCKVRDYDKSPSFCEPHDVEKEFTTTLKGAIGLLNHKILVFY
jgi:hypothetical protein